MHRHRTVPALVVVLALGLLAGCGDSEEGPVPEAQPAPDVTVFAEGDFSDIPLPPLADTAGERSEDRDVVAQSFFVRGRGPEEVLDFYAEYFEEEGVTAIADPEPFGNEGWRGSWLLDDRELLVSAIPAPAAADEAETEDPEVVTQMSLELSPADGGGHANDPAG